MSRRHRRTPPRTPASARPATPGSARVASPASVATAAPVATPASVTSGGTVAAQDLLFRLAVDRLLAERAAARAAGLPLDPRPRSVSITVPVAGMTCRSCEVRIERYVGRLPNVRRVRASAVKGRVEIESSAPVPPAAIERAINTAGYELGRTPWLVRDPAVWATALGGVVLMVAIALVAQVTGLTELASGAGDLSRGGILVALLLGLAAGVSTCMALVGGLVLALSAAFQARRGATAGDRLATRMRPAAVFVVGRVVGYGLFGAALGAIGASIALPPLLTAGLMIAVALVMTLVGTRLTGLSPRIAAWSPTLPMGLGRSLGLGDGAVDAYSDTRAAALGAASFFLPCGFTQAVQIYALSTGSPLVAGTIMAVFAIGTAPGLLAVAGLPVVVPGSLRPALLRVVGVVVLGFALVNATAGLRLATVALPLPGVGPVVAAVGSASGGGFQTLVTYQHAVGYAPENATIYAGMPTRWTIESTTTASCAASLVVPLLNISVRLHEGSNTIELPALSPGVVRYSCAMGMFFGSITIVDRPAGSTDPGTTDG